MTTTTTKRKGKQARYRVAHEGCEVAIKDDGVVRYYKFSDPYTAAIFARMVGSRRSR